jgi:uncharacterized membrane protein SpoIIM required for sporulation/ABC-type transport system involved in multi-copper enzyme maturation permease subunit
VAHDDLQPPSHGNDNSMNWQSVTTIMRREVRESLQDWRIITPITLLTFFIPLLLVSGSNQILAFIDDRDLSRRLIPFGVLLVGFIPASFSLITALESFVGERERNTLESLLAMPLSDNELYAGKLGAALLTPLVSSMLAIILFTILVIVTNPALSLQALNPARFILLTTLVCCMALAMVAASVVISSHITTVRAANLMSSFILVPMALVVQLAAFLIINDRWPTLWMVVLGLALLSGSLIRLGMGAFNREEILSREQRQGRIQLPRLHRSVESTHQFKRRATNPILVIAGRELGEVVSDWRVLTPMLVLAIGLPAGLIYGIHVALSFEVDRPSIARLIPFAALLIAFVPASFALITAIESFVGERERNSLESLLAMPLSDRSLYLGKLIAALLAPLAGSWLAMLVFLSLVTWFYPELARQGTTLPRLVQIVLMDSVITLLMVSGAVVISSHTSSIRAATLLASIVLVPSAVILQIQSVLFIAERYDLIWIILAALGVVTMILIRSGLATFNREEILSREHDELSLRGVFTTLGIFFREYRPAGVAPSEYAELPLSLQRFYRRELPALLAELRLPIGVASLAAVAGLLFGGWMAAQFQPAFLDDMAGAVGSTPAASPWLALRIFANNIRVSLLANLFSAVSFGVFAFLVPAVAFTQIGFITVALAEHSENWLALSVDSPLQFLLAYVLPHGVIELPTFILASALGLRIGAALMAPPHGFSPGQNLLWALANFAKVWLLCLLPLVLLAALVEGLVTPLVIARLYQ